MSKNRKAVFPLLWKRQPSIRRKYIFISSIVFLLILIPGSIAFTALMGQILQANESRELTKTVEIERRKLEEAVNSDIAIIHKMASSPLILQHFIDPGDEVIERLTLLDIDGYRRIFTSGSLFWVNDADKKFYNNGEYAYTVNPDNPDDYWYNMTLNETEAYNFNINFNPDLNVTNLWINAPVFDNNRKPRGILGTGINLSDFIGAIYQNYTGTADLYFFNAAGEITGARDLSLVINKVTIDKQLEHNGAELIVRALQLESSEIKHIETVSPKGTAAFGAIPALNWYITAVHHFSIGESLQTGMTILFAVMMVVIFAVFAIFNVFVARWLEPIYLIVKNISQISSDWGLKQQGGTSQRDEIGTLGEFLNMTIIDQLTGIYNRRFFDGNMKKIIKSLSRTNGKLSLLMIDIDFFKNYNDTYGHDTGDECLKEVAAVLSQCVIREEDFVARYGGEEFVAVLPNTDEKGACLIAERLLKKIREHNIPHKNSAVAGFVTVSVGATTGTVQYSQSGSDYVKRADTALYKSKHNGRNRYTFEALEEPGNSGAP